MRFLSLHLLKYGCFTDVRLEFSEPGPCVEIVLGPNEAGKSTALRGLTGLLYRIPLKTTDAFLHDMKDLRIGAVLKRADGTQRAFVRRKGNRDTLLDQGGKPLSESLLTDCLGGVTAEIFGTMFRLDHAALVRGGNELLEWKGELAESLFQAGTGITRLRDVLAAIEEEANLLYKPRAPNSLVNVTITTYEQARDRSRQLSVSPKEWVENQAALAAKEQDLGRLKQQLSELRERKERLNRFRLALPHVAMRRELLAELEGLQAVSLPKSASRDREDAQHKHLAARLQKERAEALLAELRPELEDLQVQRELVLQAAAVGHAYERLDSYRQAVRDLPKVRMQQSQAEAEARRLLEQVNPGLALTDAYTLNLTVAQTTRIRTLAKAEPVLLERLRNATARAEAAAQEVIETEQLLQQAPSPADASELRRSVERLRKHGDLDAAQEEAARLLTMAEDQAAVELERLGLWTGSLDELECLPVPSSTTIDVFESELSNIVREQELLDSQQQEIAQQASHLEAKIRALQLGGEVPTESELKDSRERRDRGWSLIRVGWRDGQSQSETITDFDPQLPLPEAYEEAVSTADTIADRLRRETDRVTRLAGFLADQEAGQERLAELQDLARALADRMHEHNQRWIDAWRLASVVPLSPREMRSWHASHGALLARACDIRSRRDAVQHFQDRIAEHDAEIRQALLGIADPGTHVPQSLSALVDQAQDCLQRIEDARAEYGRLAKDVRRLGRENAKAVQDRDKAQGDVDGWRMDWQSAVLPLGLGASASTDEALAILDILDALVIKLTEIAAQQNRVDDMESHIDSFTADVAGLVTPLAPSLGGLPPDQAVAQLQQLLATAQQDMIRRQAIESQIEAEERKVDEADFEIDHAQRTLEGLMELAQCTDLAALEQAELNSERDHELRAQLDQTVRTLRGFTGGATLEIFLAECADSNPDQLPFEITEVEQEILRVDQTRSQLDQEVGKERAAIEAIDTSGGAALAADEAQSALATVRQQVDRHVRLRLASEILRRHIERYREQNQDPVIRRAGEIFPRLTVGSFARLTTGYDEKDRPVLLGVRSSGEEVDVAGMSDGTRDQLFLALRLASLERQLLAAEPVPFVVDDILVNFDDQRARATLEVLAEVARRTQVLFFTHHRRLVELAQSAIPAAMLNVTVLSGPGNPQGAANSATIGRHYPKPHAFTASATSRGDGGQ